MELHSFMYKVPSFFCSNHHDLLFIVPVLGLEDPVSIDHFRGGTINITCSFTGLPIPTITWLKDDVVLLFSDTTLLNETTQSNATWGMRTSTVTFTSLQLTDTADYHCVANNTGAPGNTFIVQSTVSSIFVTRNIFVCTISS